MIEIAADILPLFLQGGWIPERRVTVPKFIPSGHPTREILSQLAKVTVGTCGPGQETAASDVAFRTEEPDERDEDLKLWQQLLDSRLVSIADIHNGHAELFVDDRWRFFTRSYIHDAIWFDGDSFATAMRNILLGYFPRPMLRPGQERVSCCGVWYTAESPELYRF